jgi:Flp pilus assembly protein TadG
MKRARPATRFYQRVWQRGAAALELALVLPFLLFFTLGLIEYGRYFWVAVNAVEAANAGIMAAAQTGAGASVPNCASALATTATTAGQAAATTYLTSSMNATYAGYATVTVNCVAVAPNGTVVPNPTWQIVVQMDFPTTICWRLPWMRASATAGYVKYVTPTLLRGSD